MKDWFKSLSKVVRNILCIAPFAVGGGLILLYARLENLIILVAGLAFVAVAIFFLSLNGKIAKEEKFKLSEEEEKEHERKLAESERRGEADAALIAEADLDGAIEELQKLSDKKELDYNRTSDLASRKAAAYDLMYTNAKLRAALKRKMQLVRPDANPSRESAAHGISIGIVREVELPLYTKAVGVTFDDHQACIQESQNGDSLLIKHNPSEQFPNSTDIINVRTNKSLGHIKSELADQLLITFGQHFELNGVISEITGGIPEHPVYGCNIQILSSIKESEK